jgi:hypothetical protein
VQTIDPKELAPEAVQSMAAVRADEGLAASEKVVRQAIAETFDRKTFGRDLVGAPFALTNVEHDDFVAINSQEKWIAIGNYSGGWVPGAGGVQLVE